MERPHVPAFGDWKNGDNVPYTVYFDKARKGRGGGKLINPNDPEENPDLFSNSSSSAQPPLSGARVEPEEPVRQRPGISTPERRRSREESEPHRRPARHSAGSEQSVERSPLHRQARGPAKDSGATIHSYDGKSSYDSSHGTPGRSRVRSDARGDDMPEKGAAVPKFGEWEKDPASAEGFTGIFEQVRAERQTGVGRVPGPNETPNSHIRKPIPDDSAKCFCFPWGRK